MAMPAETGEGTHVRALVLEDDMAAYKTLERKGQAFQRDGTQQLSPLKGFSGFLGLTAGSQLVQFHKKEVTICLCLVAAVCCRPRLPKELL